MHTSSSKKPSETLDAQIHDVLDIIGKLCVILRAVLAAIAKRERENKKRSKRDRAISRWQICLGVMILKLAEGLEALEPSRNVRAGVLLTRSMFEYQQKAEYFLTHRKEAFEQFGSIGARQYAELSKLAHPNEDIEPLLASAYLEWRRTSGNRNERSGNVPLKTMHLENAGEKKIKKDKDGNRYTEEFQTAYGIPSLYVHGEPLLMPEVFRKMNDDSEWDFREDYSYFDFLTVLGQAFAYLLKFCLTTAKDYDLDIAPIHALSERIRQMLNNQGVLRGSNRRLVRRAEGS